jgi:site-specific DNA recombinase
VNPVLGPVTKSRRSDRVESSAPAKVVRAAIYCRKSTDENLHSDFNSLDAQREACQAYIASMKSEGWVALESSYEDAAISGGTVDRPALQRLIEDIQNGLVDAVVVVKLDRLSRSLSQFLQLMEFMELYHIAFCAVTQQINTASSAGRLLVNVLMSFAQFEREIGSERTREKVCAARKKGRYIGGSPPLGYDIDPASHQLTVNPAEAKTVQELFRLYLERRSLLAVVKEVNERGWTKKSWQNGKGVFRNGRPFDKVCLQRLLINPLYIGQVKLHGDTYPGLQDPLVDEKTFKRVQELLDYNRNSQGVGPGTRNKHGALLNGLIKCGVCGMAMAHSYAKRGARRFRYYRCTTAQKQGRDACAAPSLPAADIEEFVVEQIRRVARDPELAREVFVEALSPQEGESAQPSEMDFDRMLSALVEFDDAWDVLAPEKRPQLFVTLIRRVVCAPDGDIQIVFRTDKCPTEVTN